MKMRRRPIRVATVSHRPHAAASDAEGTGRLMTEAEVQIRRASQMGADLVAFTEIYPQLALPDPFHQPEPAEGGTLPLARELARKHKVLLVWPRLEFDAARGIRNTAVLIDREGSIVGKYDKMFPTIGEIERGIVPGTEAPVFETEIGRIGMLICFDLNFAEVRDSLKRGEPDIVVFASNYRGGLQAQALAYELGAFVITSAPTELGLIIDRCGRILKESTYEALAVAPINTNSIAMHMNENYLKMDAMLARYGKDLTFDYHTREAFYVVEYAGDRDISELVAEFKLEPADAYYARCRKVRADMLAKFQGSKAHADAHRR